MTDEQNQNASGASRLSVGLEGWTMSNFICEKCGKQCIDSPLGYITGCEHYPADMQRLPADMKKVLHDNLWELYESENEAMIPYTNQLKSQLDRLLTIEAAYLELCGLAQAVVDRWDTPMYGDAGSMTILIDELRSVL